MARMSRTIRLGVTAAGAVVVLAAVSFPAHGGTTATSTKVGFGTPVYVDQELAGGEPEAIATGQGTLVYTAHEGTTHLFRDGVLGSPGGDGDFVTNYRNQVNIWYSQDGGVNWRRVNWNDSGFFNNPAQNTGFSDPDLTLDESGTLYDTGIDLANDALFSSTDGGVTWPTGTAQCHDGDRPWLAGGKAGEVYLATNTLEGDHTVFRSTDAGASCGLTGVADHGAGPQGTTYTGDGKLYYDHLDGTLIEPAVFDFPDGRFGLGVSTLANASRDFGSPTAGFQPHIAVAGTSMLAHWPAIAIDSAGTLYLTWDTQVRKAGTSGGCDGAETPLANSIMLTYSKDGGATWAKPITVAHPGTTVLWPWMVAGSAGNVSVAWYQYDRVTDPDCGTGKVYVYDANVYHATGARTISKVNASGRYVHEGGICQGGTTCVATGQDRRLGDYLTDAVDQNGCVIIATGDTRLLDPATGGPLPTARPLFIKQNAGVSLTGKPCG
ncbi:MAG: hypothetical protein ACJ77A_00535 [Actinomycetota bacterium]